MKKKSIIIICLVIAVMLFTASCATIEKEPDIKDKTDNDNATLLISGIIEEKNEDQLFEQSALIIRGTVSEGISSLRVKANEGYESNYTDYHVKVNEILRGTSSDEITVRVQGGTVGEHKEIYSPAPLLKEMDEYLLFLYKPNFGGGFNVKGDYYYILGVTQGIFERNGEGNFISQNGNKITYEKVKERANEYPINENYFREEYLANQKRNVENGFITEDEYKKIIDGIDIYATVIETSGNTEETEFDLRGADYYEHMPNTLKGLNLAIVEWGDVVSDVKALDPRSNDSFNYPYIGPYIGITVKYIKLYEDTFNDFEKFSAERGNNFSYCENGEALKEEYDDVIIIPEHAVPRAEKGSQALISIAKSVEGDYSVIEVTEPSGKKSPMYGVLYCLWFMGEKGEIWETDKCTTYPLFPLDNGAITFELRVSSYEEMGFFEWQDQYSHAPFLKINNYFDYFGIEPQFDYGMTIEEFEEYMRIASDPETYTRKLPPINYFVS